MKAISRSVPKSNGQSGQNTGSFHRSQCADIMLSMSLLQRKHLEEVQVIIDIGSSSVGAALVRIVKGVKPILLYTDRERLKSAEEFSAGRLAEVITGTLQNVADRVHKYALNHAAYLAVKYPRDVHCIFSSPWHLAGAKVAVVSRERPFRIGKFTLNSIHEIAERRFRSSMVKAAGSKTALGDIEVIENKIVQIKLNGYETNLPVGKEVNHVEIVVFMSTVGKSFLERVERLLRRTFPHRRIHYHSFTFLYYLLVRDTFARESDFVLLHVGGEVTDIAVVKKGVVVEIVSILIGKNSIVRNISKNLGISPQLASSIVRLYSERKIKGDLMERVASYLSAAEKEWLSLFESALLSISEGIFLPRTIFLTVNTDFGSFFKTAVEGERHSHFTITGEPFTVVLLNTERLGAHCTFQSRVARDSFLAVECVYLDRFFSLQLRP